MPNLNAELPIYVTRPHNTGNGTNTMTAIYSQSFWITMLVLWLVEFNVVAWSLYGLYTVGRLVLA